MAWQTIPNNTIISFTGKPIRLPLRDEDFEVVYKAYHCPGGCDLTFTSLSIMRDHIADEHPDFPADKVLNMIPQDQDATPSLVVLELLLTFNVQSQGQGVFAPVRKTNDAQQLTIVWQRAWLSHTRHEVLRLKDEQYKWLKALLERKVPLTKAERENMSADEKPEARTVADVMYGMTAYNVQQALLVMAERDAVDVSEPNEEGLHLLSPKGNGVEPVGVSI